MQVGSQDRIAKSLNMEEFGHLETKRKHAVHEGNGTTVTEAGGHF